jgi:hypothetical protein
VFDGVGEVMGKIREEDGCESDEVVERSVVPEEGEDGGVGGGSHGVGS